MKTDSDFTLDHTNNLFAAIEAMAKEQLLFLMTRYQMSPEEVVNLYTGHRPVSATYEAALHAIISHRTTAEL